jgi:hypothetical protein
VETLKEINELEGVSAEALYQLVLRYYPLIIALEEDSGYGYYAVQMHGRRPVKLYKIAKPRNLA